jgi:hypothetical protein
MSYATSRPIINRFFGAGDPAAWIRSHLLANVTHRKLDQARVVANAVRGVTKLHPIRIGRILRRGCCQALFLDLVN